MNPFVDHEAIKELLGVFSLNAVDPDERDLVERHLPTCSECRAELDVHYATAAALGSSIATETPDLWNNIQAQLEHPEPQPVPLHVLGRRPPQTPRRRHVQWAAGIAASIAALGGAFFAGTSYDNGTSSTPTLSAAAQAVNSPGAHTVALTSSVDSRIAARVVVLPNGHGYVYDSNLPPLPEGRTYQLWVVVNDTPISAGVLGGSVADAPFSASGPITAFAITEESAGGVVRTVHDPLVAGKVSV